jgi:ABC-2 type transport system ATP-binding protein
MLTVHNLKKYFGTKKAVDGVSFSIKSGEIFSLIGPNSAGKSTIVKTIIGLLEPTNGSVTIDGHDVVKKPEVTKALVGYIPDEPSVWSYMTGEEFLHLTQALFGIKESERKKEIPKLLETFSLTGIEKQSFDEYSRGNKQKFSILSALSHSPKLLVVDEPIVGLDPVSADIAKKLFKEYAEQGGAVLLVTHTLSVAEEISTHIGFLKNGQLVATGTLEELRKTAEVEDGASLETIYKTFA